MKTMMSTLLGAGILLGAAPLVLGDGGIDVRTPFFRLDTRDHDRGRPPHHHHHGRPHRHPGSGLRIETPFFQFDLGDRENDDWRRRYWERPGYYLGEDGRYYGRYDRAMTHYEFARVFNPRPGTHDVALIHPYTHAPARVVFTLPNDRFDEVEVERDGIVFEYDESAVGIEFEPNGRVHVEYDD